MKLSRTLFIALFLVTVKGIAQINPFGLPPIEAVELSMVNQVEDRDDFPKLLIDSIYDYEWDGGHTSTVSTTRNIYDSLNRLIEERKSFRENWGSIKFDTTKYTYNGLGLIVVEEFTKDPETFSRRKIDREFDSMKRPIKETYSIRNTPLESDWMSTADPTIYEYPTMTSKITYKFGNSSALGKYAMNRITEDSTPSGKPLLFLFESLNDTLSTYVRDYDIIHTYDSNENILSKVEAHKYFGYQDERIFGVDYAYNPEGKIISVEKYDKWMNNPKRYDKRTTYAYSDQGKIALITTNTLGFDEDLNTETVTTSVTSFYDSLERHIYSNYYWRPFNSNADTLEFRSRVTYSYNFDNDLMQVIYESYTNISESSITNCTYGDKIYSNQAEYCSSKDLISNAMISEWFDTYEDLPNGHVYQKQYGIFYIAEGTQSIVSNNTETFYHIDITLSTSIPALTSFCAPPNPYFIGQQVKCPNLIPDAAYTLWVYNTQGQVSYSKQFMGMEGWAITNEITDGIYFASITQDGRRISTQRIIIVN